MSNALCPFLIPNKLPSLTKPYLLIYCSLSQPQQLPGRWCSEMTMVENPIYPRKGSLLFITWFIYLFCYFLRVKDITKMAGDITNHNK